MEHFEVIVIGGGQAGLAVAHALQDRGIEYVVLDASHPGASWRARYDSLVLFTPSQYSALPGLPVPLQRDTYPTKNEIADYIASYAEKMDLNVQPGMRVVRLARDNGNFIVVAENDQRYTARHVVVATGALQHPSIPDWATDVDPSIPQFHTADYQNPIQVPPSERPVLVVGAGNSGAQIAEELARHRPTILSFDKLPKRFPQRFFGKDIFWWFKLFGVMDRTRSSDRSSREVVGSIPLINSTLPGLLRSGRLKRRGRAIGSEGPSIVFDKGAAVHPACVIWATGFKNDFSWIDIPDILSAAGHPRHNRGVSPCSGLYFVGLPGLHTKGSAFIGFVGADAEHLANVIHTQIKTS